MLGTLSGYAAGTAAPHPVLDRAISASASDKARHVFVEIHGAQAHAAAEESTARWRKDIQKPLDGILFSLKDNLHQAGRAARLGTACRDLWDKPATDADIVAKLQALGAICLGRTSMSELAFSGVGVNATFGTPSNALSAEAALVPGGSSSGCAVSVALSIVDFGVGSDTSGSIRVPAAMNGIVGFRPSWNRYPTRGLAPLAPSLDTIGLMTRSVGDCRFVDALLTDAPQDRGWNEIPTLVVPENVVLESADEKVLAAFWAAIERLERVGVAVVSRHIESLDLVSNAMAAHGAFVTAEAYDTLWTRVEPWRHSLDKRILQRLLDGQRQTIANKESLALARKQAKQRLSSEIRGAVLAFPTVVAETPTIRELEEDPAVFAAFNARALRNTMLGSVLDTPAVSLPFKTENLPVIGVQLSSVSGQDRALLSIASEIETLFQRKE